MFEELEKLITLIIQEYDKMFEKWQQNELYRQIKEVYFYDKTLYNNE